MNSRALITKAREVFFCLVGAAFVLYHTLGWFLLRPNHPIPYLHLISQTIVGIIGAFSLYYWNMSFEKQPADNGDCEKTKSINSSCLYWDIISEVILFAICLSTIVYDSISIIKDLGVPGVLIFAVVAFSLVQNTIDDIRVLARLRHQEATEKETIQRQPHNLLRKVIKTFFGFVWVWIIDYCYSLIFWNLNPADVSIWQRSAYYCYGGIGLFSCIVSIIHLLTENKRQREKAIGHMRNKFWQFFLYLRVCLFIAGLCLTLALILIQSPAELAMKGDEFCWETDILMMFVIIAISLLFNLCIDIRSITAASIIQNEIKGVA